jgi:hypothetical protein
MPPAAFILTSGEQESDKAEYFAETISTPLMCVLPLGDSLQRIENSYMPEVISGDYTTGANQ